MLTFFKVIRLSTYSFVTLFATLLHAEDSDIARGGGGARGGERGVGGQPVQNRPENNFNRNDATHRDARAYENRAIENRAYENGAYSSGDVAPVYVAPPGTIQNPPQLYPNQNPQTLPNSPH